MDEWTHCKAQDCGYGRCTGIKMLFKSAEDSHNHSLYVMELLNQYDDFKRSIDSVLDIGCGDGLDLQYWASLCDITEEGELGPPLNINCVGLTNNIRGPLRSIAQNHSNISVVEHDFNQIDWLPFSERKFDIVWCHDVLQYAHNPMNLLKNINNNMAENSMLYLAVPSTVNVVYRQFKNYTFADQINTFTLTQLIYLLALNGFDCADAYFKKEAYEDVIEVITYKTGEPSWNSSWYELDEMGRLSENMSQIVNRIGYLTDNGLVTKWLDGNVYDYRHHS